MEFRVIVEIKLSSSFVLSHAPCVRNGPVKSGDKCQTACKPGSVPAAKREMAIHLGRPLPDASRDRPGWRRGNPPEPEGSTIPTWSCSRWGLPCRCRYRPRGALLPHHFTLAAPSQPMAARGLAVCFCGTFPGVAPAGRYPAPYFHGARTFLPRLAAKVAIRPSGKRIKARSRGRVKCRKFLSASPIGPWPSSREEDG
jgi:hypothetical protein